MSDDWTDIKDPVGGWTVQDLVDYKNRYKGRFDYELHSSGKTAFVNWRNVYKTALNDAVEEKKIGGKWYRKEKPGKGGKKIKEIVEKEVVVVESSS